MKLISAMSAIFLPAVQTIYSFSTALLAISAK
jgi:hypothetical protein